MSAAADESNPADLDQLITLAAQLGFGRGSRRGCAVQLEELSQLRASMTDEDLAALVERVRQADDEQADLEREAEPTDRPSRRRWLRTWRRDR